MSPPPTCACIGWAERLRQMPTGGINVGTPVAIYAMDGETTRGEGRWHWLVINNKRAADTPDSGRPAAVRAAAVRHFRDRFDRHTPNCRWRQR